MKEQGGDGALTRERAVLKRAGGAVAGEHGEEPYPTVRRRRKRSPRSTDEENMYCMNSCG